VNVSGLRIKTPGKRVPPNKKTQEFLQTIFNIHQKFFLMSLMYHKFR